MSARAHVSEPNVTLVVVPRERFSHAAASLASIFAQTDYPFELVYVDGNSPPAVARHLREEAARRGFRLIRSDRFLSPNEARNLGFAAVSTEYVVFIDNDVEVQSGWLERLVQCAVETGAVAVTPLYFQGAPKDEVIHMAGGTARFTETNGLRSFKSAHAFAERRLGEVQSLLCRSETELVEFHCVLVSSAVLRAIGPLDEGLRSAHEHEDLSLRIREAGGRIFFEPAARITYTFGPLDRFDVEYAKLRWSDRWNRQSVSRFRENWKLHDGWGEPSVAWCNEHRVMLLRHASGPLNSVRRTLRRAVRGVLGTGGRARPGHP